MQGRRGMAWLAAIGWLALIICLPGKGNAADAGWWRSSNLRPPSLVLAASSSLEAQTLGEKPDLPSPANNLGILTNPQGLETDQDNRATLKLPYNLEMNVSFLYNRDNLSLHPQRSSGSLPLFNYSMDYRLLPNFKVGLSGYLYHPYADQPFLMRKPFGERVMGLGPGLKYDLGRWSFVIKSQVETGTWDRGDDWQNWLRVWYVF